MHETRLKRLRIRAWRRGFREADLILGPFADRYCADLTEAELTDFEALLQENDQDVYAWIIDTLPIPPAFDTAVMNRLRAFRASLDEHRGDDRGA
jgi:antitoxin CptB